MALRDRVVVKLLVGTKVETETIEVTRSGGRVLINRGAVTSGDIEVSEWPRKGETPLRRCIFNPQHVISIVEERAK